MEGEGAMVETGKKQPDRLGEPESVGEVTDARKRGLITHISPRYQTR